MTTSDNLPARPIGGSLSKDEFQALAQASDPEVWLANIDKPRTRQAYRDDVRDFVTFAGFTEAAEFCTVTHSQVVAWRNDLSTRLVDPKDPERRLSAATIRRKLSALSSLFDFLREQQRVTTNPVNGVKRPKNENANVGLTPALSDVQARRLLAAPIGDSLKAKRDRAILAVFLYHGMRRDELRQLRVGSLFEERGIPHFRVRGKGGKNRPIPIHQVAIAAVSEFLEAAGFEENKRAPLFPRIRKGDQIQVGEALSASGIYKLVRGYAEDAGISAERIVHALRATAATNSLENGAEISRVQMWLGHESISTTRLYDKRKTRAEDSPTFQVNY